MKENLEKCLFIGKFQPFHKGHYRVVELLKNSFKDVIIAIGSVQNNFPFTLEEKKQMIYKNTKIKKIIALEDLKEDHKYYKDWGRYVLEIIGEVDIVATGNESVKEDFYKHNIPVLWLPRYEGISGSRIREKITNGDSSWAEMVTEQTKKIVEKSRYYQKEFFNK